MKNIREERQYVEKLRLNNQNDLNREISTKQLFDRAIEKKQKEKMKYRSNKGIFNHMSLIRNMKHQSKVEQIKIRSTHQEFRDFSIWIRVQIGIQG